jgi:hypothetical protein
MKRRVLRAHANKRCLRILSASQQLRTPSSSSSERGYAVLCDASFLRAVLLSYWQAHAPSTWREARKRQLRKAAAAQQTPPCSTPRGASSTAAAAPQSAGDASIEKQRQTGVATPSHTSPSASLATIARLPVQLPAHTPVEFLDVLMSDAFQVNGSDGSARDAGDVAGECEPGPHHHHKKHTNVKSSNSSSAKKVPFFYHCLPETVSALHRMREAVVAHPATASTSSPTAEPQTSRESARQHRHRSMDATQRWLAASFGDLGTGEGGGVGFLPAAAAAAYTNASPHGWRGGASTASALTFQEIPAAVVNALLSSVSLLADPHSIAAAGTPGLSEVSGKNMGSDERGGVPAHLPASSPRTQRNEARAIADFMSFNDYCLTHGTSPSDLRQSDSSLGYAHVRLCAMPRFTDATGPLSHHALKRLRRSQRAHAQTDDTTSHDQACTAEGGTTTTTSMSRPFLPRSFLVATQSHDVRRRLAPATALLRLTTNPDALWIEQRGTAYHYDTTTDDKSGRATHTASSSANRRGIHAAAEATRRSSSAHTRTTTTIAAAAAAPTVVSAAPQLSRADVAFMKHLGTATHLPLPERPAAAHVGATAATTTTPVSAAAMTAVVSSGPSGAKWKRPRQKGQNPLSMKKRKKRETFRA